MSAAEFLPAKKTLPALRQAVQRCEGCELFKTATQAVFGQGPVSASIMLIGEQPGDEEDLKGLPFVGPAGRWLDRAMGEAGMRRDEVYLTNAVKHFKWEVRGVRRLHKHPSAREIKACRPWLDAELAAVNVRVVVCLGAVAAQALLGPSFRITTQRGKPIQNGEDAPVIATWHPSAILRAPEPSQREAMHRDLIVDLKLALKISTNSAALPSTS